MRSFHVVLLLIVCMIVPIVAHTAQEPQTSQATAALTNKDIVMMVKSGLSQEIVIAKIKSSTSTFDTSPDKLTELKNAGVPDAIILAVLQAPAVQPEVFYVKCGFGEIGVHEDPTTNPNQPGVYAVAKVNCGDTVTSLGEEDGGFQKVRTVQGVEGFITKEFLSKTKPVVSNASASSEDVVRTANVLCPNGTWQGRINLLASPGNFSPVATLKCDQQIAILNDKEPFYKVRTDDGKVGYISKDYVKDATRTTPNNAFAPDRLRAVAWRAVPWVTTSYYQQPGSANTNCTGSGNWFGNTYQGNASCTTQYTPAQQVPINWTHFTIYNQVETQDSMLVISCTRNWAFSKCTYLVPGDVFSFERKGGKISVTAQTGKNKTQDLDFDIVSSQPN